MSVTAARKIEINLTGDLVGGNSFLASENAASPAKVDIVTLPIGDTTITPPTGGSTPKALTIIPPDLNTEPILLKGIAADTGVVLHVTDPTSIALNSPTNTLVLTVTVEIVGVRLFWT